MNKLSRISISGYRSIANIVDYKPEQLNILIGQNGAGKSNFIGFFSLLRYMLSTVGHLQERVAYLGGASDLLHYGPATTDQITANIVLTTEQGDNEYQFGLQFARPDRLVFSYEQYRFLGKDSNAEFRSCGAGHEEAKLPLIDNPVSKAMTGLFNQIAYYQFHNTTDKAWIRLNNKVAENKYLRSHGENVASVLLEMKNTEPNYYLRLVRTLRMVLPFFDDFEFEVEHEKVLLRWKEKGFEYTLNAGQASDGMLRTICLFTLLLQNPAKLPDIIFIDEPELGLHPAAINILVGLLQAASEHTQLFICTQSAQIVNEVDPANISVLNRIGGTTTIKRLDPNELSDWLEDFNMSQLWEKNIIGGRP